MNNKVLANLEPANVFSYFEEICNIPHGSRDTKRISDYLVSFAKEHDLEYVQDDANNVIIKKAGQLGGESASPVIIQGHIDMVCEKVDGCDLDFENDGLRLMIEDGYVTADGTTLGGDDGIAVAYALALLDSTDIPHPPLECVFTVDEEIGMLGAAVLDMSGLKGRKFLNIDSEEEGHLLVSCAGGATVTISVPLKRRGAQGNRYRLTVTGLVGGHSGVEINKGRANASVVLGNVIKELSLADDSLKLVSVCGGLKDNAITVKSEAVFVSQKIDVLREAVSDMEQELKEIFKNTDPDITLVLENYTEEGGLCSPEVTSLYPIDELINLQFIMCFGSMPYGVIAMSKDIEGLVQTSLNLGILTTTADEINISYSVRSSVTSEKEALIDELKLLAKSVGATCVVNGEYPAWEYKKDSQLRDVMTSVYEDMFGKPMIVEAIHAGVECGIFSDALDNLDAVSFGPNILDIHTPKERLDIDSTERTWRFIQKVLSELI